MPVTVQRIDQTPSEIQIDSCANLFFSLMKDELSVLSLCGGDATLIYPLARAMIRACALEGEYYIATNEVGVLLGFCGWMPPGKVIFSTDAQRQLGFNDFMARLPEIGKEYYKTTYFAEFPGFVSKCLGGDPNWKTRFWWLHVMMVRSESQRQGVGRALIQPVLDKSSQALEPLALSTTTEKNVAKYTGLGFRLLDDKIMPSPWGDWPIYVFSKDPSAPL